MKKNVLKKLSFITAIIILGCIIIYLGIPYASAFSIGSPEFKTLTLNSSNNDYEIDLKFTEGKSFKYPLFAAWIEDSDENYIETIYVSKSISSSTFKNRVLRRPEALPCWSHRRNIKAQDGLYVPLHSAKDLDAVTGATPHSNFTIKTGSSLHNLSKFRILFEINQSFDWNDSYAKNSFPKDSIYSGPGGVGQPSVVYAVNIDKGELKDKNVFIMKAIGHGHYSGKNGIIFSNLEGITTALSIVDSIKVTIDRKTRN